MHIIQMVLQGFKLLYISLTLVNFRLRELKPTLPLQGLWQRTLPGVGALGGGWGGGETRRKLHGLLPLADRFLTPCQTRINKETGAFRTVPGLVTYTRRISDHDNTAAWGGSASAVTAWVSHRMGLSVPTWPWGRAFLGHENVTNTVQ